MKIETIISKLEAKNPLFSDSVFFFDPYADESSKWIDDCYTDSIVIKLNSDENGKEHSYTTDGLKGFIQATNYRLIACVQSNIDIQKAHGNLIGQLIDANAYILSSGADSDKIYQTNTRLTDTEDRLKSDMKLICIDFELNSLAGGDCCGISSEGC